MAITFVQVSVEDMDQVIYAHKGIQSDSYWARMVHHS